MRLKVKFNAVLLAAGVIGLAVAVPLSGRLAQEGAERDVARDVALMRANATAVRGYTLRHIEPLLTDGSDILFQPESVTSFAARTVFDAVSAEFPDYTYKEAAINPTNPADLPTPLEARMIEAFRADPSLTTLSEVIEGPGGPVLTTAFPIVIDKPGCLNCHSTPDVAPPAMVDLYGDQNGFGWEIGETVGAQIITAPMRLVTERAEETAAIVALTLGAAFLLMLMVTNFLLSRIVLRPAAALSRMAQKVSLGDFSAAEVTGTSKDEIGSLATSFNRMRRSLERAMQMLEND